MTIYGHHILSHYIISYIYIIKVESPTEKTHESFNGFNGSFHLEVAAFCLPGLAANEFMYADLELFKSKDGSWDAAWAPYFTA